MISSQRIDQLQQLLSAVAEMQKLSLIARSEWGTISFKNGERDLNLIFSLSSYLTKLPIEYFTDQAANDLQTSLEDAARVLKSIDNFRLEDGDPAARVEQITNELRNSGFSYMERMRAWIPFLAYQSGDVQENINKLQALQNAAKQIVDALKTFSSSSQKEFNDVLAATREASASAGVGVFTEDFAKQATAAGSTAKKWLGSSVLLSAVTLSFALYFYFAAIPDLSSDKVIVYLVLNKLLIFSVLISASFWSAQIYKAARHQQIVNEHKANALRTFQAFVQATADEQTRNAVLLETTRSIFSLSQSGFVPSQEPADGLKILEFFKGGVSK